MDIAADLLGGAVGDHKEDDHMREPRDEYESEREYTLSSTTGWPRDAWRPLGSGIVEELRVNVSEGAVHADFGIVWVYVDARDPRPTARLRAFEDSWAGVTIVAPLLAALHNRKPSPDEVVAALESIGFKPSRWHGQAKPLGLRA